MIDSATDGLIRLLFPAPNPYHNLIVLKIARLGLFILTVILSTDAYHSIQSGFGFQGRTYVSTLAFKAHFGRREPFGQTSQDVYTRPAVSRRDSSIRCGLLCLCDSRRQAGARQGLKAVCSRSLPCQFPQAGDYWCPSTAFLTSDNEPSIPKSLGSQMFPNST